LGNSQIGIHNSQQKDTSIQFFLSHKFILDCAREKEIYQDSIKLTFSSLLHLKLNIFCTLLCKNFTDTEEGILQAYQDK